MGLGLPQEGPNILGLPCSKKKSGPLLGRNYFSLLEFGVSETIGPLLGRTHNNDPGHNDWPEWMTGGEKWGEEWEPAK